MMEYKNIIFDKKEGVATIILNRPEQRNALDGILMKELIEVIDEIAVDKETKVVILTGGKEFFCAGADIKMFDKLSTPMEVYDFYKIKNPAHEMEKLDKPVIAAISGLALGGGCELALACDLRIASDTAIFGQPEINLGLIPGSGGTQRLPRIVGETKAKEMLFTGDIINAEEAYRIGLVNKVVPVESLMDEARKMATKLAKKPPLALRVTKAVINEGRNVDLGSALKYEAQCFCLLFSTEDRKEGLEAFLKKRAPKFIGK